MAVCWSGGSDERDMITVPPVGDDEREPPQFVLARQRSRASSSRASRKFSKWCATGLTASPFAAEPRGARRAHRRRQPARRHCRNSPRVFSAARCASAGRSASRACRKRPKGRPSPSRRACWSTRRRRISNTSNRGRTRHSMTGTGGYHRTGRTMASRKFLMPQAIGQPHGRRRTGFGQRRRSTA